MSDIDDVLAFWFEPKPTTEAELDKRGGFWFRSSDEIDKQIRDKFGDLVEQARAGKLDVWTSTPRGRLALIILLDQFSRNLYRGRPESFSADDKVLRIALEGFETGQFDALDPVERIFAAMPFQHAEDLEVQKRAVAHNAALVMTAEPYLMKFLIGCVDFARKHLDVIARFGRFPHRNAVVGRASTPEELAYLAYLKRAGQWL